MGFSYFNIKGKFLSPKHSPKSRTSPKSPNPPLIRRLLPSPELPPSVAELQKNLRFSLFATASLRRSCLFPSNLKTGQQSQQQESARKQRRCWALKLHWRFVDALQHLGGAQVAIPKQIRELMQVDILTDDEVKSHLHEKNSVISSYFS
ncbi:HTH myb-type domain-containing protein [Abeliophyllum distichum]|uniref:HTH myb-type domain-containing protein n=1 Tax=Abeliophyllum distichum TaxID=126358 RepID=A0ABD1TXT0_9LAMI